MKPQDAVRKISDVYGPDTVSRSTVQRWYSQFNESNYDLEDEPRTGRPLSIDLDKLDSIIRAEPSLTTREMATIMNTSQSTVVHGLHILGKVKKIGRWVPHLLSPQDRQRRIDTCINLLSLHHRFGWIEQIVTMDETWIYYNNEHRKAQWVDRNESAAAVPKPELHPQKAMLSFFWSSHGPDYWELLPPGTSITAEVYIAQLRKLKQNIDSHRGKNATVYFVADNARPHIAKAARDELLSYHWYILPHAPYSPDLSPTDFWVFADLHRFLDGRQFQDHHEISKAIDDYTSARSADFWRKGMKKLPERWRQVVDNGGDYI